MLKFLAGMFVAWFLSIAAVAKLVRYFGLTPEVRDFVSDVVEVTTTNLLYGEQVSPSTNRPYRWANKAKSRRTPTMSDRIAYSKMPKSATQPSRRKIHYENVRLNTREEALEVLEEMGKLIDQFKVATIADFLDLAGIPSLHSEAKEGWTDLHGVDVRRVRDGYRIDFPMPEAVPLEEING